MPLSEADDPSMPIGLDSNATAGGTIEERHAASSDAAASVGSQGSEDQETTTTRLYRVLQDFLTGAIAKCFRELQSEISLQDPLEPNAVIRRDESIESAGAESLNDNTAQDCGTEKKQEDEVVQSAEATTNYSKELSTTPRSNQDKVMASVLPHNSVGASSKRRATTTTDSNAQQSKSSRKRTKLTTDTLQKYKGDPSNIDFYSTMMKLEVFSYAGGDYLLDGKRFSEAELLVFFVKHGIPNEDKLTDKTEHAQLNERVKFAYVDLTLVTSARANIDGFSLEILDNKKIRPILFHFGFKPTTEGEHFYQPEGKAFRRPSMDLEQLRVFIRNNDSWNASGRRARLKTGDDDKCKLFGLRLWGATSTAPLPKYSNGH